MALHYNLAKVYAISDNDPDFVQQIVRVFVIDTPIDLDHIKVAIEEASRFMPIVHPSQFFYKNKFVIFWSHCRVINHEYNHYEHCWSKEITPIYIMLPVVQQNQCV